MSNLAKIIRWAIIAVAILEILGSDVNAWVRVFWLVVITVLVCYEAYKNRPAASVDTVDAITMHHFRGQLEDGKLFVYCPVGKILSGHPDDYKNKYCAWCKEYYEESNNSV